MSSTRSLVGQLADSFVDVIQKVDAEIGENRTYGPGIGPHDEDDQIDSLVQAVTQRDLFDGLISTAKSDVSTVRYPGGQAADLYLEADEKSEYCEAKLFRFQKANGNPYAREFSKVFNPFQDRNPRSFIHDVNKLAAAEIQSTKSFLGMYYRPVEGAGTEITGEEIADKFAADVTHWTDHSIEVDNVVPFSGLQHEVHHRGAVLTWTLESGK
ncbi:hypothetical protein C5B90_02980 [Haloferax sp. Atlit-12N]|uniref:hypothetical protein n=1 Tax=Haloferax sp. Atlit-12N TaxID=2077203 RepID=UPI000E2222A4|nr:hypothetical protein [Haloferax sp. Atlit-12N]RDZ65345.1 hypothetical protein C5B90_02980 [Haloferax sp. Atlit-12N]